ncbi:MAG TPA: hypothetical protein VES62_06695 [Thermoleophilaceae bacterium]|nr:hypothetical protein [Thermoleophilaceae bacterium]
MALVLASVFAGAAPAVAAVPRGGDSFAIERNGYLLGQAPDWLDERNVVFHDPFLRDDGSDGQIHIHRSTLDGKKRKCLTCGLEGPNQVPVVQPNGKWILFHSWNGHNIRLGGAGFGGVGSDVWVMTRDGKRRTNLTKSSELNDNFHAYWSPDGRHIVWTALNWNEAEGGNGRSDVRVARFEPNGPGGPRLVDEHVVRPGNGHWYETQWWAPDGSGFLYTETAGTAINPELFFCRLPDPDRGRCRQSRLTRNLAWDEQAIFTPDMKRVIFMSSRKLRGGHDNWIRLANFLDLPARFDYLLILPVFSDSFLQPRLNQATDLYDQRLKWTRGRSAVRPIGPARRLTRSGERGWIIPEFAWDPAGRRLLWTENKFPNELRIDQSCVMRKLREKFIRRLSDVDGLAELPFNLDREIRKETTDLLQDPSTFVGPEGCGGTQVDPDAQFKYEQRTRIGRYVPGR